MCLALCLAATGFSQTKITGKVSDASGNGIAFANVVLKNTNTGTTTNDDGFYSLELPDLNGTLEVFTLGYQTVSIQINGQNNIDVTLNESATGLNEVVITALGLKRETKE